MLYENEPADFGFSFIFFRIKSEQITKKPDMHKEVTIEFTQCEEFSSHNKEVSPFMACLLLDTIGKICNEKFISFCAEYVIFVQSCKIYGLKANLFQKGHFKKSEYPLF